MSRNLALLVIGVALGAVIGWTLAGKITPSTPLAAASDTAVPNAGSAPPLSDNQLNGQLPPNHPSINGAQTGSLASSDNTSPAANSAEVQQLMDAADRNAQNFDLQMGAAAAFYRAKDYQRSAVYLERALKLKPNDLDALVAMGNTKFDAKDFPAAATFYERALKIKPNDPNVQTDYGSTFLLRQPPDPKRAIVEYRKSIAIDPNHENTWQNIAEAALQLGDTATAKEAADKLAQINPSNPNVAAIREKLK